jgi:hypothetical protein
MVHGFFAQLVVEFRDDRMKPFAELTRDFSKVFEVPFVYVEIFESAQTISQYI